MTEGRIARRGFSSMERERKVEVWKGGVCEGENEDVDERVC